MARSSFRNGNRARATGASKYDAHHSVLSQTYGAFADLRRELADTRNSVADREELLRQFGDCADPQRAWLLLEDYFEKLVLTRRDFAGEDWWPRLLGAQGAARLEELAFLFLRAQRPVPGELQPYASLDRFAQVEEAAREQQLVRELENWLFPPKPALLDQPRARLRVVCVPEPDPDVATRHRLTVQFLLSRPRTASARAVCGLAGPGHAGLPRGGIICAGRWEFITWVTATHKAGPHPDGVLALSDADLLHWLARWGHTDRLETATGARLRFEGQVAELTPHLENEKQELAFTHRLRLPDGATHALADIRFFTRQPPLVLAGDTFYLLRNAPPPAVIEHWADRTAVPVRQLSHRLLTHLQNPGPSRRGLGTALCDARRPAPVCF